MRTPQSLLDEDDPDIMNVPPHNHQVDFSEYMWMEEMEEFDRQVEEELQEQEMIEQCFEDLYEMERMASEILSTSPVENALITFESPPAQAGLRANGLVMARQQEQRSIQTVVEERRICTPMLAPITGRRVIVTSKLNPLAPEFHPRGGQC